MKSKNLTKEVVKNVAAQKNEVKKAANEQNTPIKKKKHSSALVAASKARSAVSQVDAHSYRDADFPQTGTNLSYREED